MTPLPGVPLPAVLARVTAVLKAAGIEGPRREARLLAAHVLEVAPGALLADPDRMLDPAQAAALDALARRRAAREPLSRLVGRRGFWTLDLALSPDTLDPRPDTETLVQLALDLLPPAFADGRMGRVVDVGTGTGCIVLALLSERADLQGLGLDIAPGAARTARDNARAAGLGDRVAFAVSDLLAAVRGPVDLIVSNPPYIPTGVLETLDPEVIRFDPRRALDGGADGLDFYRRLAHDAPRCLAPGGHLAVEVGQGQADAVAALLSETGFEAVGTRADLAGIARCVHGRRGSQQGR
ncbi:peptide chain release factor N(5)-glutamine methyltransferase [Pararhodospirillum oryzae]|uniref:Release factor glutamine methyltransferase n=1 Tax=Pararhodospirillum oryzae TaxID=478448 RepID=A0A512H3M7_9PROT|nr:peptide chain release factor N(5)-glutamine methyltransferase [Pararhodospirillum oryzae]GEO80065.1 release factor glutamine methyltransferase [Pararhodospirillum oryzae]